MDKLSFLLFMALDANAGGVDVLMFDGRLGSGKNVSECMIQSPVKNGSFEKNCLAKGISVCLSQLASVIESSSCNVRRFFFTIWFGAYFQV